jgi:hypothetical protein
MKIERAGEFPYLAAARTSVSGLEAGSLADALGVFFGCPASVPAIRVRRGSGLVDQLKLEAPVVARFRCERLRFRGSSIRLADREDTAVLCFSHHCCHVSAVSLLHGACISLRVAERGFFCDAVAQCAAELCQRTEVASCWLARLIKRSFSTRRASALPAGWPPASQHRGQNLGEAIERSRGGGQGAIGRRGWVRRPVAQKVR